MLDYRSVTYYADQNYNIASTWISLEFLGNSLPICYLLVAIILTRLLFHFAISTTYTVFTTGLFMFHLYTHKGN